MWTGKRKRELGMYCLCDPACSRPGEPPEVQQPVYVCNCATTELSLCGLALLSTASPSFHFRRFFNLNYFWRTWAMDDAGYAAM